MSVTSTFRREGELAVLVFADHLGNKYSETSRIAIWTDAQIQAHADARAAEIAESFAEAEAEQVISQ